MTLTSNGMDLVENLENKVIKGEVFDKYNEEESKIKYFNECMLIQIGYYLWNNSNYYSLPWNRTFIKYVISQVYPESYMAINITKIKINNFRTVHDSLKKIEDYFSTKDVNDDGLSILIRNIK